MGILATQTTRESPVHRCSLIADVLTATASRGTRVSLGELSVCKPNLTSIAPESQLPEILPRLCLR